MFTVFFFLETKFESKKYRNLERRDLLMKVCGVSEHAARKTIHMYNHPEEAFENKPIGRLGYSLDSEHSSAVEETILHNKSGKSKLSKGQ
jgi:hypothetical protein